MPAGDRTGPRGMGPMTGRGAGYCARYDAPGCANARPRMGMGWRRGGGGRPGWVHGRGWRHGYHATGAPFWARYGSRTAPGTPPGYAPFTAPPTAGEEVAYLRAEAEWLRESLETITNRIDELEQEGS
jgi:hypothetical protein